MAKKTQVKSNSQSSIENRQFIEIVNWKKAQPRMKDCGQDWLKLYTSLLDHDGFAGLDDHARMLIVTLWLYAARSGLHILPADPKWLRKKIPLLNVDPDLEPLLVAADVYGNPTPFIAYCKPPKARGGSKAAKSIKAATGGTRAAKGKTAKAAGARSKAVKTAAEKKQTERIEESREEKREESRENLTLSGSEEKQREREERIRSQHQTEPQTQQQTEAEEPENPNDSEAGSATALHIVPKPALSAIRRSSPQQLGSVLRERFPDHWQDRDCEAFGWEIVRALGYPEDRHNIKSRGEWGAFASWWSKAKKSVPAAALGELRATAIRKAEFVNSPRAKSARNKSAVWTKIMRGELRIRDSPAGCGTRASP